MGTPCAAPTAYPSQAPGRGRSQVLTAGPQDDSARRMPPVQGSGGAGPSGEELTLLVELTPCQLPQA